MFYINQLMYNNVFWGGADAKNWAMWGIIHTLGMTRVHMHPTIL